MLSAIFILNHKGDIIINRIYREEVTIQTIDLFRVNIANQRGFHVHTPVNRIENFNFCHIFLKEGIWLIGVATSNVNVALIFEFLLKIRKLIWSYCGSFSETIIWKKFVLINELLDEICDYGYPQVTEVSILKNFITQSKSKHVGNKQEATTNLTNQITGQISWRKQGIKYKNYCMFMTVVEQVNLIVSNTGQPLSMSVDGSIIMKTELSGMPECKCGLNDKFLISKQQPNGASLVHRGKPLVSFDDCTFHQCVRLNNYEKDRSINFVPPDGKFELMKYRATEDILLPFRIIPLIKEVGKSHLEVNIIVKSVYAPSLLAKNIEINIPVPSATSSVRLESAKGKSRYKMSEGCIEWKIKALAGGKEVHLFAFVDLITTTSSRTKKEVRPPITLQFKVPFSCSGMRIRYLKVFEPKCNYTDSAVTKWVRYFSQAGKYEFRI